MTTREERVVLSREPFNAETDLGEIRGRTTPRGRHYVRSHFATPRSPRELVVDGAVRRRLRLRLPNDVRALGGERTLAVTLECAGNGRAFLDPTVPGEQWRLGAVGTAAWTGVPLARVLAEAVPSPDAVEVLCAGADAGEVRDAGGPIAFERSLPLDLARDEDVLLAYAMEGEPLASEHGAPLRLVVPGWYGMASVKWLARLSLLDRPFRGFYQSDRYVIDGRPLGEIEPRAIIVSPREGQRIAPGGHVVRGFAWAGRTAIRSVEASADGGRSWTPARLGPAISSYAWREWEWDWDARPGHAVVLVRATDDRGRTQPSIPRRNPLGYANNAIRAVRFTVG